MALVLLQVSVEDAPLAIDAGLAEKVSVGTGGAVAVTVTVVDLFAVPPAPEHARL